MSVIDRHFSKFIRVGLGGVGVEVVWSIGEMFPVNGCSNDDDDIVDNSVTGVRGLASSVVSMEILVTADIVDSRFLDDAE